MLAVWDRVHDRHRIQRQEPLQLRAHPIEASGLDFDNLFSIKDICHAALHRDFMLRFIRSVIVFQHRVNRLFRKGTDTITFPVFTDDPLLCCSKARSFFRCHSLSQPPQF